MPPSQTDADRKRSRTLLRPPRFLPRQLAGVRVRLSMLVLLAVLPALGLIVYSGLARRDEDADRAEEHALEITRVIASRHADTQEDARQLLGLLSVLPDIGEAESCKALLKSLEPQLSRYRSIGVVDTQGDVFCTNLVLTQPLNVADRGYFVEATTEHHFTQSYFQISRVTGQPSVAYAYPWTDQEGNGPGALIASLDLGWLSGSLNEVGLPEGSVVTLLDKDGIVLARYPEADGLVGQSVQDSALFHAVQDGTEGTFDAAGLQGVQSTYAFTRVGGGDNAAYLTLGTPKSLVLAEANQGLERNLGLLGAAAVLTLVAAWLFGDLFFAKRIKALVRSSREIASGDLAVRSGISKWDGELGELSLAFNDMASSLEARQAASVASEEELRRSNAELEQFAYVASHDLQEPLRMVSNYTQLLARRYEGRLDNDADEFIGFAVEGAQRMQNLINDLLEFSRVGTKGRDLAPVGLESPLKRALLNLSSAIEESGADVKYGSLPVVEADEAQLVQLLQNLIANAIKFRAEEPPRIEVKAELNAGSWAVSVSDNGIGIDPDYKERIFVIFQRLHTRAEYPGTGIGLAVCKRIVERHGGNIWVDSVAGGGATFFFTLRAVRSEAAAA